MNVEDEPSSGLNGRLRPRKSATHGLQIKDARKSDSKYFHEKSKKSNTQSKVSPNKPDDLHDKSDSSPALNFLCPYCDKKFVSKQTVSKHSRRIHLSTFKQDHHFIRCLFCNHTESEPNNIIRHMVDSHPNQYFACFDCHTRFSSTSELAEHKLNVCEKQKPYRSKLRQKTSSVNKIPKNLNLNCKSGFRANCKEYSTETGYNGIVISCELKPAQVRDAADIEDNITTNLILPSNKNIGNNSLLEKNAVIVLDDIQWNKRLPPNFTLHNTDADQILSRLGVIHRTTRTGEGTKREWLKSFEDSSQKFEKCFDTSFYAQVASNVQENLAKFLDGSFNFNPDAENVIKTRKAKNSVIINTVEGFPILLNCEQYSRNVFDSYLPRTLAPKHKCKWGSLENDKIVINPDQLKRDSHTNNCIITLVSSLDIWTQLCMRRKYEDKFCQSSVEKKTEKRNLIDKELKEILESRELPVTSSQVVKYVDKPASSGLSLDFPFSLGLTPSAPQYQIQPAVLSGEWVRPRCYVCCACGAQTRDARALTSHISTQHPNAQVQHSEIVGESLLNADILKHLYVPPSQPTNRTRPLRGFRECTKCKMPASLEELHQHMLDCAGDTPTVRRKCRYRPFGVRRRRPRLPDNTIRKKIRKDIRNRQNQKGYMRPRARPRIKTEVGDAETIRKMLADLPAKRHRVMINPVNSMLRPRRKFDLQRNTLLIKRRPSDDPKNRKLRNKDVSHSRNVGEPTPKKMTSKENTKPMRAKMKPMASKSGGQNESFKRSKRSVKETNSDGEENDLGENANDDPPNDLPLPEGKSSGGPSNQEASDSPEKMDINGGPYKTREQSGGHKGANSGSSGSYAKGGQSDSGGNGDNPGGGGNDPNGDRSNNNNGSPSDGRENGDKYPVQNTPLKHSIARLTANSETHDKSVQFHHLFLVQQECNNVTEHAPTGQRELFENEAVVTKLDKPPLHYPKGALDPYTLQKGKLNKPRKGLNDCIAMLKNKLVDPPSLPAIGQVSVQCGDDEPIEPIHYTPTTIFESGINMTPAEIFYRPILSQSPMLSNRCNMQNLVSYPYPIAQTMVTATRAEKPKARQKKLSQSCNRSLPKQKQDEYLIKRTSTRVKSLTRAEIKMHHELMRLPSQIEIIPQQSEKVYDMKSSNVPCNDSYQTSESFVMLNQKKMTDSLNQKRRVSVDVKIQHNQTNKNSVIVPSTTTITFDSQCQINWSNEETTKDKSPKCNVQNSQTNPMQTLVMDSTTLKPPKEKSPCNHIISNDIHSEANYNDISPSIPPAHSSTTVESILSIPLDLSGKSVSVNQLEKTLQADDSCYNTNYDSYGTLDLSNKRSDYLLVTTEDAVTDLVVDLSIKSVDQKQTNSNVYLNLSADVPDILTDLSSSICEIENFPKDLSMKVNEVNSCHDSLENLSYEVEDLSGSKGPGAGENHLHYYSSGVNDIDKDIPTDLSDKRNKKNLDLPQLSSISEKNEGVKEFLEMTQNKDLPADLSAKNSKEKHTILPSDLDVVPNMRMESTQDTNINTSSSSIADKSQEETHDTLLTMAQYKIRDSTTSEGMVVVDILENSDANLLLLKPPCTTVQLGLVQSYGPIFNYSNIAMQEIHTSAELSMSLKDQSSYEYTPTHVNITTSAIRGGIPLCTIPISIQSNPIGKFECTKPVYTLANACISTTKIETLNGNTLSNTLLSVPGTTFANTTPVYTLAGTSVGMQISCEKVPYTKNEITPIIDNNTLCHSSISPSHDVNRVIDHHTLSSEVGGKAVKGTKFSTEVGSDIEKGTNVSMEVGEGVNVSTEVGEGLEKGTKNTYSTIAADLDSDAISKIAKLPKEIVEILGTMPVDHRKQLLNILPHYVTTSTSSLNIQDTNARPESASLPNTVSSKKSSYLQVQTADSTSGSKIFNNMKMEDEYQENFNKCQNAIASEIRLIPLPPSPQPSLTCEIVRNDTTVIVQSEQINLHNTITTESNCCDIKTIDLTQDDNVDLLGYTNKKDDDADQSTMVTASKKKDTIASKENRHKINDQTASLRAVRIKTPSERLKVVSAENQLLLKNQIEVSKQNASLEENKVDNKQLTIKTAAVNIKVTGESHSAVISQVDFESNSKKLKDESTKKSSEYITIKIDVDQDSQNDHFINSGLNSTTKKTNDINCTHSNKTHINLDAINETIKNASLIEINGVTPKKNNDTIESVDHVVSKSNSKKDINNDNKHNTWVNSSVDNEKEMSDDDDSEDDILLAVIVKQKREKQNINKIEKDPKYHDTYDYNRQTNKLIDASTTCNEIKFKTKEQHVTPLITSCNSNAEDDNEVQELEREESVNVSTTTSNKNSTKHLEDEQKNLNKLASDANNDIQSTVHQIEKVDMGVQYECISKELYDENDSKFIVTNTNTTIFNNSDEQIVKINKQQKRTSNVVDENNSHKNNAKDFDSSGNTVNGKDSQNENSTFGYACNDKAQNDWENLEITSEMRESNASEKQNMTICPRQEECIMLDDTKQRKDIQNSDCPDQLKSIDGEKHSFAIELSLASDIEKRTQIPLRRSRRGKSMFVNRNVTIAYDDDNATNVDVLLEKKTPLTKKQLIFSKLLLDEENHTDIPIHSIPEKSHNIDKDGVNNPENSIADIVTQTLHSSSEIHLNKTKKRAKSAQDPRKNKKKKILQKIDISDTDDCLQSTKVSEAGSNYSTKLVATDDDINAYRKSKTVTTESKCDQQIESSFIKADSRLKSAEVLDITITECTSTTPAISEVVCNDVNNCQESLVSTETQKLITPTTNTDLTIYSRLKRTKPKLKNAAVQSAFIQHDDSKEDARIEHKNTTFNNAEPRTTCYNRPVASKRTRSKSTIVKTTEKELTYDPYDIDLDDMIANAEPVERKRVKSERVILANQVHTLTELPSTSTPKEIKKREVSPVIRRKVKKSIKHRDRLRRQKRIKDTSDSDDSSKSDVPLTKYVKNREKRAKQSYDDLSDRDDYDIDLSDASSNDKKSRSDCRNKKRTLTNCNNADTSSSHDETEERLKSEQFMESFGFFSERKPRKSNLIAAKKISETFHVIANESEDVCVGYRERAIKRALQSDGKKAKEGECSRAQGPSNARRKPKRAARKKKICTQILRYLCIICKKEFRRPDNYLRHQMTLLHISRLSEELKIKINPIMEEPNYLIIYKQHIDRLKIITDKLAKKKKNSKSVSKITLPTLTEILVEVNRVVREQILSRRGLSRDEALFLDCCELLKESRRNDGDPNNVMNSNYRCPQATMTGLALIEKQIDDDKSDCKSDGEVDSITAKNILESEEVRNLENDLISGLKEAANANNAHNMNCLSYQNADDNARMDPNDNANESFPNPSHFGQTADKFENVKEPSTSKVKKPEVKRMMYPDIIEDIDMFEDKFDKIKRKCRSQAAAAKQNQNVVESNTSQKIRKKTDKKKIKRNSKKKHLSTQVPTKGALKGFDSVKVSTSQPEPEQFTNSHERSKKKKKKCGSKKKKEKKDSELSNKRESDSHINDTTNAAHKKIDVYEFMDNEDAELFEFRPSTLMERFKSINNKAVPSTSKITPQDDPENSSDTVSDGDDFVYISDDYVGTDDETENSMSCETANAKATNEAKKTVSPLKRKDAIEKNAVMGKIFKNNAVRAEKKLITPKEISNPKANMDQLFDSLLENGPCPSEISKSSKLPERCSRNVSMTAFEKTPHSSPNYVVSPTKSLKNYDLKSSEACASASNRCNEYIDYNTPSTSKKLDELSKVDYNTESNKCIAKSKNYKEISPKKDLDTTESNIQDTVKSNTQMVVSTYHERLSNSNYPPTNLNSQEKYKIKSPLKKPDESIGTSYDFSAELLDQLSHDDDTGVAKQRARRKCTVGKQKVLAETWSSESEPDGAPPRPNSAASKESDSARKRRGKKKEGHSSSGRRGNNRSITFKKHDESRVSSCNRNQLSDHGEPSRDVENTSISRGGIKWIRDYRTRDEGPSCSGVGLHKPTSSVSLSNPSAPSSKVRPRPSSYYWSSDGDDEQEHPQQHGWIVGDSHKKLVTMLAHAKGRKRNNDDKRHLVE